MAETAVPSRRRRPRHRPFGVLVLCALLVFQAVLVLLAGLAFLQVDTTDMADTNFALSALGLDFSVAPDAGLAIRLLTIGFATVFVLTFVQVVLLLLLKRIGWVLTMLVVGAALFLQLLSIWLGGQADSLSMLLYAVTALYLNQSDVRRVFGIGASRIDRVIARSADAVDGAIGDAS